MRNLPLKRPRATITERDMLEVFKHVGGDAEKLGRDMAKSLHQDGVEDNWTFCSLDEDAFVVASG